MARIFIIAMLLTSTLAASSQGSWGIGYIEADSINSNDVSRLVKIDFKGNRYIEEKYRYARNYIETSDTGQITIEGKTIQLVERRFIYPDQGYYNEQYLECPDYNKFHILKVYETEIMDVKKDSILFRLYTELFFKRKGKLRDDPIRGAVLIWIDRTKLDGVMIKK